MNNELELLVNHLSPEERKKHRDAVFLTVITPFATIGIAAMNLFLTETKSGFTTSGWLILAGAVFSVFNYSQARKLEKLALSREETSSTKIDIV